MTLHLLKLGEFVDKKMNVWMLFLIDSFLCAKKKSVTSFDAYFSSYKHFSSKHERTTEQRHTHDDEHRSVGLVGWRVERLRFKSMNPVEKEENK